MNTGGVLDRLVLALCGWLLALRGRSLRQEIRHRDRRGRFIGRVGAGPAPARNPDEALLNDLNYSPRMLKAATPFTRDPDEPHDAFQLRLRNWVLDNMDTWINGRHCSPWTVFSNLKDTWAIDRLQYAAQTSHAKTQAAALPRVPKVYKDQYVAWYTPPATAHHTSVGTPFMASAVGTWLAASAESQLAGNNQLDPQRGEQAESLAPNLGVLGDLAVNPTFAGEARLAPTADRASPVPTGSTAIRVVVPRYDPDYDVVANLPKKLKQARCRCKYLQGFGNDRQQAIDSYEARNFADMGGEMYGMFKVPCTVWEEYDSAGRRYFVARADFEKQWEERSERLQVTERVGAGPVPARADREQDADQAGAADGPSAYGSQSKEPVPESGTGDIAGGKAWQSATKITELAQETSAVDLPQAGSPVPLSETDNWRLTTGNSIPSAINPQPLAMNSRPPPYRRLAHLPGLDDP